MASLHALHGKQNVASYSDSATEGEHSDSISQPPQSLASTSPLNSGKANLIPHQQHCGAPTHTQETLTVLNSQKQLGEDTEPNTTRADSSSAIATKHKHATSEETNDKSTAQKSGLFITVHPIVPPHTPIEGLSRFPDYDMAIGMFGGPANLGIAADFKWSRCLLVDDTGTLGLGENVTEISRFPCLDQRVLRSTLFQQVRSACRIKVISEDVETWLSGVWIHTDHIDLVLTVAHWKGDPNTVKAQVWSTYAAGSDFALPTTQCKCIAVLKSPLSLDFALFRSLDTPRQPYALPLDFLAARENITGNLKRELALSIGYNAEPADDSAHNEDAAKTYSCGCIKCIENAMRSVDGVERRNVQDRLEEKKLEIKEQLNASSGYQHSLEDEHRYKVAIQEVAGLEALLQQKSICNLRPSIKPLLNPEMRVLTTGFWTDTSEDGFFRHSATGWHGISGAGMYAYDQPTNKFWCIALYQGAYFGEGDSYENKGIPLTCRVIDWIRDHGKASAVLA
ncbi:hypothetical protein EJ08DRAFT_702748 [Tothia fuscella]|uniref:Uncharacterized protein n=1 Tax=Tothia fuscella TaxID=1048955 RepID=A0A9P4NG09_9PEZI|nr:hypothetical protein EJ08DRAFT_702748 [Tothia fuscella]